MNPRRGGGKRRSAPLLLRARCRQWLFASEPPYNTDG